MATYTATRAINGNSTYRHDYAGVPICAYSTYTTTTVPANGDVFEMLRVPKNARILECVLKSTDIDTNGTPTVTLAVGDTGDDDRLITGSNIGQAGGSTSSIVSSTGLFYQYTAETVISVKVTAGPATAANGTFELMVRYIVV